MQVEEMLELAYTAFDNGSYLEALELFLQLSENDNVAAAMCAIGSMYHCGLGVEIDAKFQGAPASDPLSTPASDITSSTVNV